MASGFERLVAKRGSPPPPAFIPGIGDAYKFVKPKRRPRRVTHHFRGQTTPYLNRYPGFTGTNKRD
jgi:hypothetical protein